MGDIARGQPYPHPYPYLYPHPEAWTYLVYISQLLIANGANVNAKHRKRELRVTALHCAAIGGHAVVAELLIKALIGTLIQP